MGLFLFAFFPSPNWPAVVETPGPEGAVGLDGQGMGLPGGQGRPVCILTDLDRLGVIGVVAVPQLTVIILVPRPRGAVGLDSQAEEPAGSHGLPVIVP
jgi:hypothetical protein